MKPSATKRARSRWGLGERLSFVEIDQLASKAEKADELKRRLDDVAKLAQPKAGGSPKQAKAAKRALARVEAMKRKLERGAKKKP